MSKKNHKKAKLSLIAIGVAVLALWTQRGSAEVQNMANIFPVATQGQATVVEPLCGQSDQVREFILQKLGTTKVIHEGTLSGVQGANHRKMLMLEDRTWILMYEFWDAVEADRDVTCVVATGEPRDAYEAINIRIQTLPSRSVGPAPRGLSVVERAIRAPVRRLDI